MDKPRILIQFDSDPHASVFDAVVAIDSDVDQLLQYGGVGEKQIRDLVHGAMFTRGPDQLHRTAIFVGGSDVIAGQRLFEAITACFFGPMRVSVLMDCNGCNTTAAAAVLCAEKHVDLSGATVAVLGATGPVGSRAVRLAARQGAKVRVCSRGADRAQAVIDQVAVELDHQKFSAHATVNSMETIAAVKGADVLIAAGAAGVELLPKEALRACDGLQVAIDLNAVPPAGLGGIDALDRGESRGSVVCYGPIGVGATKMKIHKAAIRRLFESNDQIMDAEQVFDLGHELFARSTG